MSGDFRNKNQKEKKKKEEGRRIKIENYLCGHGI